MLVVAASPGQGVWGMKLATASGLRMAKINGWGEGVTAAALFVAWFTFSGREGRGLGGMAQGRRRAADTVVSCLKTIRLSRSVWRACSTRS